VARYRLSDPAKADIASVLRSSDTVHGAAARIRYRALLTAAMRRVAADPQGRSSTDRSEICEGVRSFHIRHARSESREAQVNDPVHVLFYRMREPGIVEIISFLHERMEPSQHVETKR
jgi:toxin ParE1/3/4